MMKHIPECEYLVDEVLFLFGNLDIGQAFTCDIE
jgi:hypothetical protein